ncbi:trypsin [Brienomyrus brachyistius]|uniref:trypsin n=1 Tax=Brienomyrus brachyistius TaxID=42636 RepID=UPI0020B28193|nr:trypsin [Brienomyrus brachyistius]
MDVLLGLKCMFLELIVVSCYDFMQSRIVGGYAPAPHSIKYMVSIQNDKGQHFCGGSLINKYWVLTAAHCNIGSSQMVIVAGDYSLSVYEGTEQFFTPRVLVPHPEYNKSTNNADIMLIRLKVPVQLNSFVTVAPLPRQGASVSEGRVCRVSGWGYTSSSGAQIPATLRTVKVPIVSAVHCNSSQSFGGNITANMICAGYSAGGKDACKGDSGGPLVCEGRVYGVVSWGNSCASAKYPGVYTAVSQYRSWIDQTINSFYGKYITATVFYKCLCYSTGPSLQQNPQPELERSSWNF